MASTLLFGVRFAERICQLQELLRDKPGLLTRLVEQLSQILQKPTGVGDFFESKARLQIVAVVAPPKVLSEIVMSEETSRAVRTEHELVVRVAHFRPELLVDDELFVQLVIPMGKLASPFVWTTLPHEEVLAEFSLVLEFVRDPPRL